MPNVGELCRVLHPPLLSQSYNWSPEYCTFKRSLNHSTWRTSTSTTSWTLVCAAQWKWVNVLPKWDYNIDIYTTHHPSFYKLASNLCLNYKDLDKEWIINYLQSIRKKANNANTSFLIYFLLLIEIHSKLVNNVWNPLIKK